MPTLNIFKNKAFSTDALRQEINGISHRGPRFGAWLKAAKKELASARELLLRINAQRKREEE